MRIALSCLLFVLLLSVTACFKKSSGCTINNVVAPPAEVTAVQNYLSSKNITTAIKDPSGFYYEIVSPGTGTAPGECSGVNVGYIGKLTNDNVFDQSQSLSIGLSSVIEGWRKGLPLIQKGGEIKLYIPPTLGYGPIDVKDQQGNVVIPANSILIFDVHLIDVQ